MKAVELINSIKEIMINVATGKAKIEEINNEYKEIYVSLHEYYTKLNRENPNPFSDLWEFYYYWKKNLPTYADRREYVIKLYKTPVDNDKSSFIDFWSLIHPKIVSIAKSRMDSRHFADAVEASLKEINSIVKSIVKNKTGKEFDGADLMGKAFSPQNPIILLDDLSSETGKNIQQGYMQIFIGSIIGIRNPKAHENINIDEYSAP